MPFGPTKTATVNGTSLAYREEGEGEPVVFVHGAISDLRTWDHQLPGVGRSCRAVTYSRRFHHPNPPIEAEAEDPWASHVDDLIAFLHEIDAAPAHLVGNSQGAYINLLAAIQHPGAVRALIIEEPPVIPILLGAPPRPTRLLPLLLSRREPRSPWLGFISGHSRRLKKRSARGMTRRPCIYSAAPLLEVCSTNGSPRPG